MVFSYCEFVYPLKNSTEFIISSSSHEGFIISEGVSQEFLKAVSSNKGKFKVTKNSKTFF